jgi:3-phenylpropionate/trans-cinnamate dioxygenase ferredoxin reductase subunit
MWGKWKAGSEKTYRITLFNRNKTEQVSFDADAKQTILEAAEKAGLVYPHSCRSGTCRACRSYLLDGKVKEMTDFAFVLSAEELGEGMILACQSRPESDLQVVNDATFRLTKKKAGEADAVKGS